MAIIKQGTSDNEFVLFLVHNIQVFEYSTLTQVRKSKEMAVQIKTLIKKCLDSLITGNQC